MWGNAKKRLSCSIASPCECLLDLLRLLSSFEFISSCLISNQGNVLRVFHHLAVRQKSVRGPQNYCSRRRIGVELSTFRLDWLFCDVSLRCFFTATIYIADFWLWGLREHIALFPILQDVRSYSRSIWQSLFKGRRPWYQGNAFSRRLIIKTWVLLSNWKGGLCDVEKIMIDMIRLTNLSIH